MKISAFTDTSSRCLVLSFTNVSSLQFCLNSGSSIFDNMRHFNVEVTLFNWQQCIIPVHKIQSLRKQPEN